MEMQLDGWGADMSNMEELLARRRAVHDAILAVLETGQSVQIGSRKVTRADLNALQKWLDRVDQEIAAAQDVSPFFDSAYQVYFDGR